VSGKQEYKMRHGEGPARAKTVRGQQSDAEFVALELSKDEKAALREFAAEMDDLDEFIKDILTDGTKLTMKDDERNSCYVVFAFAPEGSDNGGYILTGRGGTPTRAMRELLYKDRILLDHVWESYHNRSRADGDDDW